MCLSLRFLKKNLRRWWNNYFFLSSSEDEEEEEGAKNDVMESQSTEEN